MDFGLILKFMYDFAFFLSLFAISLSWILFIGRQSLINVLVGSYLALLFFTQFPFQDFLLSISSDPLIKAMLLIALFIFFIFIMTFIIKKVMPLEFYEGKFENMGRKIILAGGVTIFYSTLCFTILPIQDIIAIHTPLQTFLTTGNVYYYSLLLPLASLTVQ